VVTTSTDPHSDPRCSILMCSGFPEASEVCTPRPRPAQKAPVGPAGPGITVSWPHRAPLTDRWRHLEDNEQSGGLLGTSRAEPELQVSVLEEALLSVLVNHCEVCGSVLLLVRRTRANRLQDLAQKPRDPVRCRLGLCSATRTQRPETTGNCRRPSDQTLTESSHCNVMKFARRARIKSTETLCDSPAFGPNPH
jgi:hypothetical protein